MANKPGVLITGGSSGIGWELSRLMAQKGHPILWVSLEKSELMQASERLKEEFPKVQLEYLALDLSQPESSREAHAWAAKQFEVDILVNNAGFGTYGYIQNISIERELSMLQLHVMELYLMTRLFLQDMLLRDRGQIINISSNTALQAVPRMSTYAASKAFVKHFSVSLAEELKQQKSNVKLSVLCPAAIRDTAFQEAAGMDRVRTFSSFFTTTPQEVSRDAYRLIESGKALRLSGARMRWVQSLRFLSPPALMRYMLNRELDPMK